MDTLEEFQRKSNERSSDVWFLSSTLCDGGYIAISELYETEYVNPDYRICRIVVDLDVETPMPDHLIDYRVHGLRVVMASDSGTVIVKISNIISINGSSDVFKLLLKLYGKEAFVLEAGIHVRSASKIMLVVYLFGASDIYLNKPQLLAMARLFAILHPPDDNELNLMGEFLTESEQQLSVNPAGLKSQLMPFQQRSLAWMIEREKGSIVVDQGDVATYDFWERIREHFFVNRRTGHFMYLPTQLEPRPLVEGGILADEMGLGKTVITLALILSSPAPSIHTEMPPFEQHLIFSPATLIITPKAILNQWIEEIKKHTTAGKLKFMVYEYSSDFEGDLTQYDIIITTFSSLKDEIHVANFTTERSRRYERKYARPISPLTRHHFWRIVIDEAQMVSASSASIRSLSNTGKMCSMLHATKRWGVTGTPISKTGTIDDLKYLIFFLNVQDWLECSTSEWRTISQAYPYLLKLRLGQLMRRTMKSSITHELQIPVQYNHVIFMKMERVPQAYYDSVLEQLLHESRSDVKRTHRSQKSLGVRSLLLQLRQACCHPQLGSHNRKLLGTDLRTMDGVLKLMAFQVRSYLFSLEHQRLAKSLEIALSLDEEHDHDGAIEVYKKRLVECEQTMDAINSRIADLEALQASNQGKIDGDTEETLNSMIQDGNVSDELITTEPDNEDSDELTGMKTRLSTWQEMKHRILYFMANSYFLKGEYLQNIRDGTNNTNSCPSDPSEDSVEFSNVLSEYKQLEEAYYEKANDVRQQVLKAHKERFKVVSEQTKLKFEFYGNRLMEKKNNISIVMRLVDERNNELTGGIQTTDIFDRTKNIMIRLNQQWEYFAVWRLELIESLMKSLEEEDEEKQAEEFSIGIEVQQKADALLHAMSECVDDREGLLIGVHGELSRHFYGQSELQAELFGIRKRLKLKKSSEKPLLVLIEELKSLMKGSEDDVFLELDSAEEDALQSPSPVKKSKGKNKVTKKTGKSKKSSQKKQEKHISGLKNIRRIEIDLAKISLDAIAPQYKFQLEKLEIMKRELSIFNELSNVRIKYYKELQKFNDGVIQIEFPEDIASARLSLQEEMASLEQNILHAEGRRRYFQNLEKEHQQKLSDFFVDKSCPICTEKFVRGLVLECGHMLCESCYQEWMRAQIRCPTCNQPVDESTVKRIVTTYRREDDNEPNIVAAAHDLEVVEQMKRVSIKGSFGTKLDAVVRHMVHIKTTSGAKCIVFSQWDTLLDILCKALKENDIRTVNLSKGTKAITEFQTNPEITAIMLNARSQSSGLTLTEAKHIFMLEPVLDRAIERQATGRVHRIGQECETHVWRYLMKNTVEESLHEIRENMPMTYRASRLAPKGLGGGEDFTDEQLAEIIKRQK